MAVPQREFEFDRLLLLDYKVFAIVPALSRTTIPERRTSSFKVRRKPSVLSANILNSELENLVSFLRAMHFAELGGGVEHLVTERLRVHFTGPHGHSIPGLSEFASDYYLVRASKQPFHRILFLIDLNAESVCESIEVGVGLPGAWILALFQKTGHLACHGPGAVVPLYQRDHASRPVWSKTPAPAKRAPWPLLNVLPAFSILRRAHPGI